MSFECGHPRENPPLRARARIPACGQHGWAPRISPLVRHGGVSNHAATKYISGHSDVLWAAVTKSSMEACARRSARLATANPGRLLPGLLGFSHIGVRMKHQMQSALRWHVAAAALDVRAAHPALGTIRTQIWKRTSGVAAASRSRRHYSGQEKAVRRSQRLHLCGIARRGGFESLVQYAHITAIVAPRLGSRFPVIRRHRSRRPDDLIADLSRRCGHEAKPANCFRSRFPLFVVSGDQ